MRRIRSNIKRASGASLATALSTASLLMISGQAATANAAGADSSNIIEEVVVTARRKEESLLKAPVTIAAVTGDELAAKGITSFTQLADSTPGINVTNVAGGGGRSDRSFQQITLRGIVPSSTVSVLTATFIDGVPVASATAIMSVNDPARVEILKGPQAAYFGRNTFAGAVNVVNRDPGSEFGGSASLMSGSRGNMDLSASLGGPLWSDKFGFRIGAHVFQKQGSYNNPTQPGQHLGDQRTQTFNALMTAHFTDNFSAKVFALYSHDHDGPSAQGLASAYEVRVNNGQVNLPNLSGNTNGTVVVPSLSNCSISGYASGRVATEARVTRQFICGAVPMIDYRYSPAQNTFSDGLLSASLANPAQRVVAPADGAQGYGLVREYTHAHLNLDYVFGDSGFTLSSLTGLNREFYSEVADLDNIDTSVFTYPGATNNLFNPARRSFWDFAFGVERKTQDFSQELRLSFDNKGPFSGTFGVSYLKTLVWNNLINISSEALFGLNRNSLTSASKTPVDTQSAFFGATYKFTDALKLSVEGRYQTDKVGAYSTSGGATTVSAAGAAQFGVPAGVYAPLTKIIEAKYNNFLPRVIAQYDFNPDLMGYASYSKGVNVGTNTINTAFLGLSALAIQQAVDLGLQVVLKPEKLANYELGLKGKFLDGRVQLQAAAYYAIWTDQLNTRSRTFLDPSIGNTAQLVSGPANTGKATLQGFEFDIVAKPVEHIELNVAGAMTDSSIRTFSTPTISQITGVIDDGFKGKQLPQSSKYSMNLGVQYSNTLARWQDSTWFARADLSWKDKQYLDQSNITWIKARSVVNLRAGINRGAVSVDAFVNNAFNDKNYVGVIQGTLLLPGFTTPSGGANNELLMQLPELRVYGARISYKF